MAREIDNFLIRNFCNDFDQKERSGPKIRLQTHFKGIRDLFGKNPECSSWPTTTENNEISIRETLYSLDEVWSECQLIKSKINLVPPFDPIKNKLSKIKSDIEKFKESIQSSNGTQPNNSVVSENEVHRQSSRSVNASKVHGFDDDVISLEKQVLVRQGSEDRFKAIGITGIAGIGKTALCQSLFISKQVKDYFLPRIWVCLSKQPGDGTNQKVAILKRMLVSLGVEKEITEGNELKGLLYALHLQLQGKRYLIVFDDARETDEWYGKLNSSSTRDGKWDALAHGLPKGCGGAVIVTSRNEELAKTMVGREGILHRVLPLSNPDFCWSIFLEAAGLDKKKFITAPSDVEIQKREIFKRCAGLPLTAKMLGQIITQQPPGEVAPNEIESHQAEEAAPNPVGAAPNEIESHQAEEAAPNPVGAAPNEIESDQEVPVPAEGADPNPEGAAEEAAPIDHVTEEEDDASNGSEP